MSEQRNPENQLPPFRLPEVGGGFLDLSAVAAEARLLTAVFWSATCSHCRRYDSYLNAFRQRHPDVALLVVAARQGETIANLRATVEQRSLRFPLVQDEDLSVARSWDVRQTPRAFLLTPDLHWLYRGAIDNFTYPEDPSHEPYLEDAIEAVLAGRPVARAETPGFGCPVASVYYQQTSPFDRSGNGP